MANPLTYDVRYPGAPQAAGLAGEIAARIADMIIRGAKHVPARIESLRRTIEQRVLKEGLRGGFLTIVRRFRLEFRRKPSQKGVASDDWQVLVERIEGHGRTTTIENYSAFLFSVDVPSLDGR